VDREHLILREVVETHIDSGDAVGSKAVAERLRSTLSSASIRAVMASLGERGLLAQPHTSAGRVPTDRGYREYLDAILGPQVFSRRATGRIQQRLEELGARDATSPVELMRGAAATVAAELGVAAMVVSPRLESAILQRMDLVWLGPGRILAICVTDAGLVHERFLTVTRDVERRDLEAFTNYLNERLPGRSLAEVRQAIERATPELAPIEGPAQREDRSALADKALELGQRALAIDEQREADLIVEGVSRVLAQREFAEVPERASELLRSIEERQVWLELLDVVQSSADTRVYIGQEAPDPGLASCGLVVTRFSAGRATGIVAVFGPKRLDYRRAIPLVSLVGQRLGELLFGRHEPDEPRERSA